ncbi:MAG: hypothetical protein ACOZBW_07245 [Thermodesulfobacteriota bacterium]
MTDNKAPTTINRAVEVLTGIAVNREEVKRMLAGLPDSEAVNKTAVEYEIQLLRIVFTGWALSYFMAHHSKKDELAQSYWFSIHTFARQVSSLAAGSAGVTVDYFEAIRERTRTYIDAMNNNMTEADPTAVVGATFSLLCGAAETPPVNEAGKKMFINTLATVKTYLETVEINGSPV